MRKLRIGVIDLVSKGPTKALWARVMNANLASIMPQAVAVWCQEEGHDVTFRCYTGFENLAEELPENVDVVFIGAFTEAAQLAYALSNQFRSRGAVTVIGGPHARCYPQDAQKYFDYVLGFTDKSIIKNVLDDCAPHRPLGIRLSAAKQPTHIPGVRDRWEFIEATLRKAPVLHMVPMLGSVGCPYTCSFCIDSTVPYQPLSFDVLRDDLRFLLTKFKRPLVGWHDPNFGVRFDDFLDVIEDAVPPGSINFIAESSLSLLSEPRMIRLRHNGFKAFLPGIESWYDLGEKSRSGHAQGMDKVRRISDHVNMILRYVPYVQTNFVLGLDVDAGAEPFELTKRFVDLTPGAFPGYSLLSAFGEAAPINYEYQRENRVIPFPFHFLNNNSAMNLKPVNYSWSSFYEHVADLTRYTFSPRAIARRLQATNEFIPKWLNVVRAVSSEGYGRIKHYNTIRHMLDEDQQFRSFFEQQTDEIPQFYVNRVKRDLGAMWEWLPDGALTHDPNAYLKSELEKQAVVPEVQLMVVNE
ncbi:MAG: radical SAM protein [Ignavibacteriae bacterium]|nr:radical SAM protein [Ignavibacteriota bacterium]